MKALAKEMMNKNHFLERVSGSIQATPLYDKANNTGRKAKKNRKKSIDRIKSLANQFLDQDSDEDDDTPANVRLYFDPKNIVGSGVTASKEASELTPTVFEDALFPLEIKQTKKPLQTISNFGTSKRYKKSNRTPIKDKKGNLKLLGMLQLH